MYVRMIARDFARNRGVTAILVVLMMLAVTLATASAGTLARLTGASSTIMSQAAAPHVVQLHAGTLDQEAVDRWAAGRDEVAHHQIMFLLGIDGADLFFDGVPQTDNIQQNSLVVPNRERDLLLDLDNEPITEVEPGTIYLPVLYEIEAGLQVGDSVRITAADGYVKNLTIAGFARDSIMNPAIASSKRLAVSPSDLEQVRAHTGEEERMVEFWLHDPATQTAVFEKAYQDSDMPRAGQMVDAATFRMLTMIGDGLVAGVVILVSVLLLVVGLLCLRFSLLTATEQDYREIGVLKAIGVAPGDAKKIYLTKYALLAGISTVIGLLGGWALTPLLTRNITRYMGSAPSSWNWIVPALVAVLIFGLMVLFVLVLLRRVNQISAVAALSASGTGRQSSAAPLRLHRSRMPVHARLAAMDVIGRWPTYLLLLLVFAVSTFIIIVPISAATTASAPGFIHYMGTGSVDLRIDLRHTDDTSPQQFSRTVQILESDPDAVEIAPMVTTRNGTIDADELEISLYIENGDHTLLPVTYTEGSAPTTASEIALSLLALNQTGRQVGDALPVEVGGELRDVTIVGSYQDITNGGKTAKSVMPTHSNDVMWYMAGVKLSPGVDATEKAQAFSAQLSAAQVSVIEQWREQTLGPIARQITLTALLSAAAALSLAMLMTGLFTRMLIARDAHPIAVQRAVGAGDRGLRRQYLMRILIVLALGLLVGTMAANTLGEALFNLMFEGFFGGIQALGQGTSRIDFSVDPRLAYLALPAALFSAVAVATTASSRSISDVDVSTLTTE